MALKQVTAIKVYGQSLVFPNAYHAIASIDGDKSLINLCIVVYPDGNKERIIQQRNYSFTLDVQDDAPNPYKQGYEYLKTLPEYSEAEDILEGDQAA